MLHGNAEVKQHRSRVDPLASNPAQAVTITLSLMTISAPSPCTRSGMNHFLRPRPLQIGWEWSQ
eukprot:335608-Pyramimonas_sp.AAC.1